MTLNIYLTFDGNCREAFEFYKSVFGGDYGAFITFGEGPPEMGVKEEDKDRVLHVSLPVGSSTLMGSDTMEGMGGPFQAGNNFSISIVGESRAHCDELFPRLAEGGEVTMPLQDTFWNAYFGMCHDRFGIQWMINYDLGGEEG